MSGLSRQHLTSVGRGNDERHAPAKKKKYILTAYCTSKQCDKGLKRDRYAAGIVKDVDSKVDFCPDCGSALFWKRRADGKIKQRLLREEETGL